MAWGKSCGWISLILVCLSMARASACGDLLQSKFTRIDGRFLKFDAQTQRQFKRLQIRAHQLREFAAANVVFAIPMGRDQFWSVVFEPNPGHDDRGFLITGRLRHGKVEVESVGRADYEAQVDYFRRVASMHALDSVTLPIRNAIGDCTSMVVSGWRRAKIWLKHRIALDDLAHVLLTTTDEFVIYKGRFALTTFDQQHRLIRVILDGQAPCPNGLITAFVDHAP